MMRVRLLLKYMIYEPSYKVVDGDEDHAGDVPPGDGLGVQGLARFDPA